MRTGSFDPDFPSDIETKFGYPYDRLADSLHRLDLTDLHLVVASPPPYAEVGKRLNRQRQGLLEAGLLQLPQLHGFQGGRNGEALDTDEAAVWKRVLNYRLASFLRPRSVLETHPGLGVSTDLYRHASPTTEMVSLAGSSAMRSRSIDLIDIDPFGSPWATIEAISPVISKQTVIQVSNGEAHAVRRNLRRGQKYPTAFFGHRLPQWVVHEYLPRLEDALGVPVRFYYGFPTTIRAVLAAQSLPDDLWRGCPRWMWWLAKYSDSQAR